MSTICDLPIDQTQAPGQACVSCGHTNLVHPGDQNPAIDECQLCKLVAVVADQAHRPITVRFEEPTP